MAKRRFNEAERYVIRRWAAAFELEESMASAREKYQQLCHQIVKDFIEAHPEFYCARLKVIQISGNQPGAICISKQAWPKDGKTASGFWVENIRLEHVTDEDTPPPLLSVWVKPLEERGEDVLAYAKRRIATEAVAKLPKELLAKAAKTFYDDGGYAVAYEFAGKSEFLELLANPDQERFTDLITEQLEAICALAPVIDELVGLKK